MRSSPKLLLLGLLLGLALATPVWSKDKDADKTKAGEKKKDDKKKGDDKKKTADKKKDKQGDDTNATASTDDASPGGRISLPLPPGHDSKVLKIPYYDGQGNMKMNFSITLARRLDEDNVKMEDTQVETYNEEGEVEMTVQLPVSNLNLVNHIITSQTKTTITRDDFVITGDSVKFDTDKKIASLVGNVHMTIYDLNDEAGSPSKPKTEATAAPVATPE